MQDSCPSRSSWRKLAHEFFSSCPKGGYGALLYFPFEAGVVRPARSVCLWSLFGELRDVLRIEQSARSGRDQVWLALPARVRWM